MLSIIVPHYQEPYLDKTLQGLKDNATGEIEILAIEGTQGMRAAVNEGLRRAQGDFIMKVDAHCLFGKGYDEILTNDCAENWLVVPRRYSLIEDGWTRDEKGKVRDYHYLTFPKETPWGYGIFPIDWFKKGLEEVKIDDTMTFQGSCWFANRKYFMEHIGLLDDRPETYGTFADEPLEVGLKYWLGGGEVKVNKKTWYAHLRKTKHHYNSHKFAYRHKRDEDAISGHIWGANHWLHNEEPNMIHKFDWLIEKFWPVPSWPEDWRKLWV